MGGDVESKGGRTDGSSVFPVSDRGFCSSTEPLKTFRVVEESPLCGGATDACFDPSLTCVVSEVGAVGSHSEATHCQDSQYIKFPTKEDRLTSRAASTTTTTKVTISPRNPPLVLRVSK